MGMAADVGMTDDGPASEKKPLGLPTLQRNALCKLFERSDFTPEEVLAVGYARLRKVNGIGPKGLDIIAAWLEAYGLVLRNSELDRAGRHVRRVDRAIRLLERYGYEVRPPSTPR